MQLGDLWWSSWAWVGEELIPSQRKTRGERVRGGGSNSDLARGGRIWKRHEALARG